MLPSCRKVTWFSTQLHCCLKGQVMTEEMKVSATNFQIDVLIYITRYFPTPSHCTTKISGLCSIWKTKSTI